MAPALAAAGGGELVAIVSTSSERASDFAARHDVQHCYGRVEDLLEHRDVFDAAYVSTANDSHCLLAAAVADAGRHVLCEKPLTVTVAEADELVGHCARVGVVLGVNHHLRAVNAHRLVRQLIEDGAIGAPRMVQVTHTFDLSDAEQRWRGRRKQGGGVVLDATTHDVDLVRFLLGSEISCVSALAVELEVTGGEVEDGVTGWMLTDAGVRVSFTDAFQQSPARSELVVHGTAGALQLIGAMDQVGQRTLLRRVRNGATSPIDVAEDNPYTVTLEAFHAAVRGEGQPLASGADGAAALHVADAVIRSAAAAGVVVPMGSPPPTPAASARSGPGA
jgi:1,5-anhydro-D-fructose reductase (1,5-anhydro-D-mannitol-forming)